MSASETEMNCEEFKKAIAAEPQASFEGGAEHVAACESCAAFMAEMQALDARIASALAIDVPEMKIPDLPAIEDDNVVNMPFAARRKAPTWMAIAASFALAAFIGVQLVSNQADDGISLEEEILAHVLAGGESLFDVPELEVDQLVQIARVAIVVNQRVGRRDRLFGGADLFQRLVRDVDQVEGGGRDLLAHRGDGRQARLHGVGKVIDQHAAVVVPCCIDARVVEIVVRAGPVDELVDVFDIIERRERCG